MITQVIGPIPPPVPVAGAVTPSLLFIGGLVLWSAFAVIVAAAARDEGGVRGAAAITSYLMPVIGTIMFIAATSTS